MKTFPTYQFPVFVCRLPFSLGATLISCGLLLFSGLARAGDATWDLNPGSGDWNTATNWTPMTVPNGSGDVATFDFSNTTHVSISAKTEVNGITFNAAATNFYTITASLGSTLTLSGAGITNISGTTQNFVTTIDNAGNVGGITFTNSATAGNGTSFTNKGATGTGAGGSNVNMQFFGSSTAGSGTFTDDGGDSAAGGEISFHDNSSAANGTFINIASTNATGGGAILFFNTSSAGNGTFTNYGATFSSGSYGAFIVFRGTSTAANGTFISNGATASNGQGGLVDFVENSTASNGTFINNPGIVNGASGGSTQFYGTSTAGNATITNNGGAVGGGSFGTLTMFRDSSSASGATIVANGGTSGGLGGTILFLDGSTGGTSRIEVFGNGNLDISDHGGGTIGSIEGDGNIFVGANNLTVGSNSLNTTFAGVIQDGGLVGGTGGSLTKAGGGKLTLTNANSYTGGTTIKKGILIANNTTGSATGDGLMQVISGTLCGTGIIGGAVTVGNGTSAGAVLRGGAANNAGTLSVNSLVTFNSGASYKCYLNRTSTPKAGTVKAVGVTINANVPFTLVETGTAVIPRGTRFKVIDNTSGNLISGRFSNLPNGYTFTDTHGTTFKVNYTGGTGNDLMLIVQ